MDPLWQNLLDLHMILNAYFLPVNSMIASLWIDLLNGVDHDQLASYVSWSGFTLFSEKGYTWEIIGLDKKKIERKIVNIF